MSLALYDRVKETSTTTGTGDFTLAGAFSGYRTFDSTVSTGNTTYYCIELSAAGEWEVGLGTLSGSTTLQRTSVLASSNSNSLVNFSAGQKTVFLTLPASVIVYTGGSYSDPAWITSLAGSKITGNISGNAGGLTSTLAVTSGGTGTATQFTAGSVVFAGASGIYAQDNSNLYWDDTNNRLGIGTASPSILLHVRSATVGNYYQCILENTAASGFGGAGLKFTTDTNTFDLLFTRGAVTPSNSLLFYDRTNSAYRMVINGTGLVGINETSIGAQLQVTASGSSVKTLILKGAASQSANLLELQNSSGTGLSGFSSDGSLGIGTNAPSYPLHVSKSLASNLIIGLQNTSSSASAQALMYIINDGGNGLYFGVTSVAGTGTSGIANSAFISMDGGLAALKVFTSNSKPLIFGGGSGGGELARFTSTGTFQISGAAAGVKKLIVQGASSETANLIELQNSSGTALVTIGASGEFDIINDGTSVYPLAVKKNTSTSGVTIYNQDAGPLSASWLVHNAATKTLANTAYHGLYCSSGFWEYISGSTGSGTTKGIRWSVDGGITYPLTIATTGQITATAVESTIKPLVIKGAASQSANLLELQNSSGTALASFNSTCTVLTMPSGFAIGAGTHTVSTGSVLLGDNASGYSYGIAIGYGAVAGTYSIGNIAIGKSASSNYSYDIAIGESAYLNSGYGAAIGAFANGGSYANSIALGAYAAVSEAASCTINTALNTSGAATVINLQGQSSTSARPIARLATAWGVSTDATRTGRLTLSTYYTSTAQEAIRIDSASDQARVAVGGAIISGVRTSIYTGVATDKGLVIQGASSQSANLFELQNSSGTAYVTVGPPTLSGSSTTSNFFNVTGTLPSSASDALFGNYIKITGAGSHSQVSIATRIEYAAGYTGSAVYTCAAQILNASASTITANPVSGAFVGNIGVATWASATTTGYNYGTSSEAFGGDRNVGVLGWAVTLKNSATNVGVIGLGRNTGTSPIQVGGYFGLNSTTPTFASAALMCDNSDQTSDIFVARDNGTAVFTIADGGTTTISNIAAGTKKLIVKGSASESARLLEFQNSSGTAYSYFGANQECVIQSAANGTVSLKVYGGGAAAGPLSVYDASSNLVFYVNPSGEAVVNGSGGAIYFYSNMTRYLTVSPYGVGHMFDVGYAGASSLVITNTYGNSNYTSTNLPVTLRVDGGNFRVTAKSTSAVPLTVNPAPTLTVTNKALTSNVATLTVSQSQNQYHGLIAGDIITVAGVDATFNGTYTLTATTYNTVSYSKTAGDVASTSSSGTVTPTITGNLANFTDPAGTPLSWFTKDGYLSIGSGATPQGPLHIWATETLEGATSMSVLRLGSSTTTYGYIGKWSSGGVPGIIIKPAYGSGTQSGSAVIYAPHNYVGTGDTTLVLFTATPASGYSVLYAYDTVGLVLNTYSGTSTYGDIIFRPRETERARFTYQGTLQLSGAASGVKKLVIKGAASESANLVELQNSSGTALSVFDSSGHLGIGADGTSAYYRFRATGASGIGGYYFDDKGFGAAGLTVTDGTYAVRVHGSSLIITSPADTYSRLSIGTTASLFAMYVTGTGVINWANNSATADTSLGRNSGASGGLIATVTDASFKVLTIKGAASQTANLAEFQTSTGEARTTVASNGQVILTAASSPNNYYPLEIRGTGIAPSIPDYSSLFGSGVVGSTTYALFGSYSLSNGGMNLSGFNSSGQPSYAALSLTGYHGSTSPTGSVIEFNSYKHNGSTSRTALAASEKVAGFTNGGTEVMSIQGGGTTTITLNSASTKGLIVQGAASQSANLLEFQNSSGTALASFNSNCTVLTTPHNIAIGNGASASGGTTGLALGTNSVASTGLSVVAVGRSASATGNPSSAFGNYASAAGAGSTAIGESCTVDSGCTAGLAIGYLARCDTAAYTTAIGCRTYTNVANKFVINSCYTVSTGTNFVIQGVPDSLYVSSYAYDMSSFANSWVSDVTASRTARLKISTYYTSTAQEAIRIDSASDQARVAVGGAILSGVRTSIYTGVATDKGLVVRGSASQSANLLECQDSSGTVAASVSVSGTYQGLTVGTNSGNWFITCQNTGSGAGVRLFAGGAAGITSTGTNDLILYTQDSALGCIGIRYDNGWTRIGSGIVGSGAAGQLHVYNSNASFPCAIFQGAASQSANLLELRNSSGTALASFNAACSVLTMPASFAIGSGATAVALGGSALALGDSATANTSGDGSIAIGRSSNCTGSLSIAIGRSAQATADNSVSMGYGSYATAQQTTAIGFSCVSQASYGVAIGVRAYTATTTNFSVNACGTTNTGTNLVIQGVPDSFNGGSQAYDMVNVKAAWVDTATATRTAQLTLSPLYITTAQEGLRIQSASDQARVAVGGAIISGVRTSIYTGVATDKGLVIQGAASQSANLAEFQNSSGTAYVTVGPPTLGVANTSNFLNVTGTLPTSQTNFSVGVRHSITSASAGNGKNQYASYTQLLAGGTNTAFYIAGGFDCAAAGTGVGFPNAYSGNFNTGVYSAASGSTAGHNVGATGLAYNSSVLNVGLLGETPIASTATNIGVGGFALNTTAVQIGGYFGLQTTLPSFTSAALMCDNGATTSDIFVARDNGTAVVSIIDGGNVGIGTASPSYKLHVSGSGSDTNGNGDVRVQSSSVYGTTINIQNDSTGGGTFGLISTGVSASFGAGKFAIYRTGGYVFSVTWNGEYIAGLNYYSPLGQLTVVPYHAGNKGLVVQGYASQTANLAEFQNSSGTAYVTVGPPTLSGSSTTSNFFNVTGTLHSAPSAQSNGVNFTITSAGSSSATTYAFFARLLAGYTGNSYTGVGCFLNTAAGTGTDLISIATGNSGVYAEATATTTGHNCGVHANAAGGDRNYGIIGLAYTAKNNATNIGVIGLGRNTGTSPVQVGGFFGLSAPSPTFASAALMCDNSDQTSDIFVARDNGTAVFTIADGGTTTISNIAAGTKKLIIKGSASETANLLEFQNSSSTVLLSYGMFLYDPFGGSRSGIDFGSNAGLFSTSNGTIDFTVSTGIGLRVIKATVFATDDLFFQAKSGASGYGVFEGYGGSGTIVSSAPGTNLLIAPGRTTTATFSSTALTFADAINLTVGTSTGTKIGTSTSQKLGFFNATPVVQPSSTTDLRTALINLGLYASGGASPLDLNGGALSGYSASTNAQTGTTYTLAASDLGKVVTLSNASAITLTLPNSLSAGFVCTVIQKGAGQVTFSAAGGATLRNRQSQTKTAGQYAVCTLYVDSNSGGSAADYYLAGDTGA